MRSTAKISTVREYVKKINSNKLTLSLGRISLLIIDIRVYTINRSKPILIVVLSLHAPKRVSSHKKFNDLTFHHVIKCMRKQTKVVQNLLKIKTIKTSKLFTNNFYFIYTKRT